MKLYTVATHNEGYFDVLKESAERNGLELKVLGWGQKWQGFTWRLHLMLDALSKENPDDIIMFVDAFDVIITQPSTEIERRFKSMNVPYLFSTAYLDWCIHIRKRLAIYELVFPNIDDVYINAGVYIGYAGKLRKLLINVLEYSKSLPKKYQNDDQAIIIRYFLKYPTQLHVDKYSQFSVTVISHLRYVDDMVVKINGRYVSTCSFMEPCVIHCVGAGPMERFIQVYDYKSPNNPSRGKYHIWYMFDKVKMLMS